MVLSKLLRLAEIEMSANDLSSGYMLASAAGLEIEELFCDSRKVVSGGLYIALEGLHTDSHLYLDEAIAHGAVAAVVSQKAISDGRIDTMRCKIPLVRVENCRDAFARIYAAWYSNPQQKMKFIGVTGTNGKTSVCRMIYHVLTSLGHRCGLIGTTGGISMGGAVDLTPSSALANMTTPDPPQLYRALDVMQRDGVEYVIMEVTSHALELCKVSPISFEVGVFTNLTEDHLDFHLDMDSYFAAKSKLFGSCRRAVINIDDKYGRQLAENVSVNKYTCSAEGRGADLCAVDIRANNQKGIEYKLVSSKMRLRISCRMPGMMNVMNTMQTAAVCQLCGASPREIKDCLGTFEGVCGRLERLKLDGRVDFSVYIDYAHTPDALENLLRTARQFSRRGQRIVLLFGCGGDREVQKRARMGKIASDMSDFFVVTSDNSRSERPLDIINDILSGVDGGATYTVIENRKKAIEYVIENARKGDVILLAGKGHEEYEIDADGKRPFSEREIVREYVSRYHL